MRTLLLATGNPLRGDDGAAGELLRLIPPASGLETLQLHQLAPETAESIAPFARVVFLDADARAVLPVIEPLPAAARSPLTHAVHPGEIVALARSLYGFAGEAYLCRIPARDFSPGCALSPETPPALRLAAAELERFLAASNSAVPRSA